MTIGIITNCYEPSIQQLLKIKDFIHKNQKVNIGNFTNGDQFLINYFGKSKFNIIDTINAHCTRNTIIDKSDVVLHLMRR